MPGSTPMFIEYPSIAESALFCQVTRTSQSKKAREVFEATLPGQQRVRGPRFTRAKKKRK